MVDGLFRMPCNTLDFVLNALADEKTCGRHCAKEGRISIASPTRNMVVQVQDYFFIICERAEQ